MRFIVGFGVVGVASVDMPLLAGVRTGVETRLDQRLSIALVPGGGLIAAMLSAFLGGLVGWRGLFAIGLLPALTAAFVIRVYRCRSRRAG